MTGPARSLSLHLLPDRLAVCRLDAAAAVPAWAWTGPLASVTRTGEEVSIVCDERALPAGTDVAGGGLRVERGRRALKVDGPLDLSLTGVLAGLTVPLADAGVPVFAVSTFDTDYLLVEDAHLDEAVHALVHAGHVIRT